MNKIISDLMSVRTNFGPARSHCDTHGQRCWDIVTEAADHITALTYDLECARAVIEDLNHQIGGFTEALKAERRWIPVEEALPDKYIDALWWDNDATEIVISHRRESPNVKEQFTHWQKLPASPESERGDSDE